LKGLDELEPDYDLCPNICGEAQAQGLKTVRKNSLCGDCPRREAKENFFEQSEFFLNEQIGKGWRKYGLKNLYHAVLETFGLESFDQNFLTLTAKRMVDVLLNERQRMERIERWNEKQNRKSQT
jgi:hypothetical protein